MGWSSSNGSLLRSPSDPESRIKESQERNVDFPAFWVLGAIFGSTASG
jgi:hypothetical protein